MGEKKQRLKSEHLQLIKVSVNFRQLYVHISSVSAMENRNEGEYIDSFTLSDIEDNPANELDDDSEAEDVEM